ncbi:MAG: acyl-CoA carboxylase subunit beta, partial [Burkholderiales bacterium]
MPVLESTIDLSGSAFAANRLEMLKLLDGVRALEDRVRHISDERRAQFDARGQLMPRDRVDYLL